MEKRNSARPFSTCPPAAFSPIFAFLVSIFALLFWGCGTPGEPIPPRHAVPQAVSDLSARQVGGQVVLTFTLPKKAMDGGALENLPSVEIYRGGGPPVQGVPPRKITMQLVHTIPSAVVENYVTQERMEFRDALPPEVLSNSAGTPVVYSVRTRATPKRASADSNVASLRVYPAPQPIADARANVTETALELSWRAPATATTGGALTLAGFRVYRATLAPGAEATAIADISTAKLQVPLTLLASPTEPNLRDPQFEFGQTYLYVVRSVARYDSTQVESADSNPVLVTPRDVFPPAPPKNPVAIPVPAVAGAPAHVELSWAISPETDLAGYNVYRSESPETPARGERLNPDLLLAPSFRDMTAQPGHRYAYCITAVDRAGNESEPSPAVVAELPPQQR